MKTENIQLSHEWVIVKPDRLKTFKHIEYLPILPKEKEDTMSIVKDTMETPEPGEVEVEEVERTIAYVIQQGTVVNIGPGESLYELGDKVFIRGNTGLDFQWLAVPSKGTSPKLLKKHEIIAKVI